MESFEFIVEGPAISLRAKKANAKRYQRWLKSVRAAARRHWARNKAVAGQAIEVTITNYYTLSPPDVDNIIKPILDALETVVYINDQQVHRVISEKFDLSQTDRIKNPSPLLAAALEKYTELLHIRVTWNPED